ncbi:4'-phosphopantetheinyl transferase family protein [Nonomuraea polychroma]|uniref:4'-phosphopantetheinyl transferase family protein n=1 Tax=Nonomuraea polychroma TaxID=46176 RepID=UPI003D8A9B88
MLQPRACEVWRVDVSRSHEALMGVLSTEERARWSRLRRTEDRDRFRCAWALVRLVLADKLDRDPAELSFHRTCRMCGKPHGKPRLAVPGHEGVDFSLSHSGDQAIAAFSAGIDVGVDIEQVDRVVDVRTVAPAVLAERELAQLAMLGWRPADFLTWWTRKEAVLKSTGHGLTVELPEVEVSGPHEPPHVRAVPRDLGEPSSFSLHQIDVGSGARAALAAKGKIRTLTVHDGSALLEDVPG